MTKNIAARNPNGLLVGDPAHPEGAFSIVVTLGHHDGSRLRPTLRTLLN